MRSLGAHLTPELLHPPKRHRIRTAPKPTRRPPRKLTATIAELVLARQMFEAERSRRDDTSEAEAEDDDETASATEWHDPGVHTSPTGDTSRVQAVP